jgi:hypothetical protein
MWCAGYCAPIGRSPWRESPICVELDLDDGLRGPPLFPYMRSCRLPLSCTPWPAVSGTRRTRKCNVDLNVDDIFPITNTVRGQSWSTARMCGVLGSVLRHRRWRTVSFKRVSDRIIRFDRCRSRPSYFTLQVYDISDQVASPQMPELTKDATVLHGGCYCSAVRYTISIPPYEERHIIRTNEQNLGKGSHSTSGQTLQRTY